MKIAACILIKLNNQYLPRENTVLLNTKSTCDCMFEMTGEVNIINRKEIKELNNLGSARNGSHSTVRKFVEKLIAKQS